MSRILYECSELIHAAGGIRRLYRHVEILRHRGFDAYILHHTPGFRIRWFENSAPIEYWTGAFELSSQDTLVIPEGHTSIMRKTLTMSCQRVVIALNWKHIFTVLGDEENWNTLGIETVIAGSNYEQEFIWNTMAIRSSVIASGIDAQLFQPLDKRKPCIIAYMPQKNRDYAYVIEGAFRSKFGKFLDVQFLPIEGRTHREVADTLGYSAIFLAHTFPEGLSRKMLEAMACGCVVVGFAGHGSQECMDDGVNCFQVADGDVLGVVERLGEAVARFYDRSDQRMRRAAIETTMSYSLEREEDAVVNFWSEYCGCL